jgi:hypothetical protein
MTRRSNTAVEIVASGEFVKVARKRYMHGATGQEIVWDCNAWVWRTPDGLGFTVLHGAVSWFRQSLAA